MNSMEKLKQQFSKVKNFVSPPTEAIQKHNVSIELSNEKLAQLPAQEISNKTNKTQSDERTETANVNRLQQVLKWVNVKRERLQSHTGNLKGQIVNIASPIAEQIKKSAQVISPISKQEQKQNSTVKETQEQLKNAVKSRDDAKQYSKLGDSLKSLNKQIEATQKQIGAIKSPKSPVGKWEKAFAEDKLGKLNTRRGDIVKQRHKVEERLQHSGFDTRNESKIVGKSEEKVKKLQQEYDFEKQAQTRDKRDDRITRANNQFSAVANVNKTRSDLVNFITSTVGAFADLQGKSGPAAKALEKWNTATGQLTISLGKFLTPALESLSHFVKIAVDTINGFMVQFPNLSKWIGYGIGALIALMAVIVPIIAITGTFSAAVAVFGSAFALFSSLAGIVATAVGVIGGVLKAIFLGVMAFTGPIVAVIGAIVALGAIFYTFSDEIFAIFSGIYDFVAGIFSSIAEKLSGLFSGFSLFSSKEEKQAEKVNAYKKKTKEQTDKVENTITKSNEANHFQSKVSGAISIKAATCILALSGSSIALAADKQISEQAGNIPFVQANAESKVNLDKSHKLSNAVQNGNSQLAVSSHYSSVSKQLDETFTKANTSLNNVPQITLPAKIEKASLRVTENQIVSPEQATVENASSTQLAGMITQVSPTARISANESKSIHIEGSKFEINVTAQNGGDHQALATAIRRELEKQQAEQMRQLRGMLND